MIKTCLFDLGNVLAFFSHERMCQQLAEVYAVDVREIQAIVMKPTWIDPWERGLIHKSEIYQLLNHYLKQEPDKHRIETAFADIFTPNQEILPILECLKQKQIRLVLLSNTCDTHFEFLEKSLPALSLFDSYVLSYEVGFRKPDVEIFQQAIKQIDCEPEACFYTDDIEIYVKQAQELGFKGMVFKSTKQLHDELSRLNVL